MKNYRACASCKHNRTKCVPDCPLAPYFPAHMHQKYRNAHKVFGESHLTKFVKNLADSPHKRSTAMKHITAEPVGASFGVINKLRRKIAEEQEGLRRLRLVLSVYRGGGNANVVAQLEQGGNIVQGYPRQELTNTNAQSRGFLHALLHQVQGNIFDLREHDAIPGEHKSEQ